MTRPVATIVVAVIVLTWGACFLFDGKALDSALLKPFSLAVSVLAGASLAYDLWLWHWPLVHLLCKKPRLTGTWVGELRSDYKREPSDDPLPPIASVIVVTQTASVLHVRLFTKESSSTSVAASIETEPGDRFSLSTVYRNEPGLELQARSPIHYGATRLEVSGAPRTPEKLRGFYWTSRQPSKTAGTMNFAFVSRTVVHSFEEGVTLVQKVTSANAKAPA